MQISLFTSDFSGSVLFRFHAEVGKKPFLPTSKWNLHNTYIFIQYMDDFGSPFVLQFHSI